MTDTEPPPVPEKLRRWLEWAIQVEASDLHLIVGYPPVVRIHGTLTQLTDPPLTAEESEPLLLSICPPDGLSRFRESKNTDFSFGLPVGSRIARFRASLFNAGQQLGGCIRLIPNSIPDFEWAGFPQGLATRLSNLRDGLVIVTGATGSGKTTTLAMIVQQMNETGGFRIITVEEPVEYVFPQVPSSVVTQREVGMDVLTFSDGLKYGLRQDPDVILVGEIRDRETAQMALSAAETGHLVFTTLHTRDAKGAISRFADFFVQDAQSTIRGQLAMSLRAIVSQRLLPGVERAAKRHLAIEVLWNVHAIASAIRTNKLESIDNYLLTGREDGMISFDESVRQLLRSGKITRKVAEENVNDVMVLKR
ncbi:MAG TPA: PilT/PilU family type 4a pilus ATPase [Gemmata sp.]|jgi:twitching motility protein PilT|nr:PilT/PilU family type 4a pilus ATPase [Gemmata sp.]